MSGENQDFFGSCPPAGLSKNLPVAKGHANAC